MAIEMREILIETIILGQSIIIDRYTAAWICVGLTAGGIALTSLCLRSLYRQLSKEKAIERFVVGPQETSPSQNRSVQNDPNH